MNDRCSSKQHHIRSTSGKKYQAWNNNALKQKNYSIDSLRDEINETSHQTDRSHQFSVTIEQPFLPNIPQCSNISFYRNLLTKDREIAKLKALVYQKDNELITLVTTHKTALLQVEDQIERERKVWNEHKEFLLADERVKFEEEKTRLLKDLQHQLNLERERCQHLEEKLYDAQMQSSEAKFLLKENDRKRINAIYCIKEQCRKEYQDEMIRLRKQFLLEKDVELARIQERIRELEETTNHLSAENAGTSACQHKLLLNLEIAEKSCVRSINDIIKKLLLAMDSSSHIYSTLPNISSFVYDETAVIERTPTQKILKALQNTVENIRNYIIEQRIQIETKTKLLQKSKLSKDRITDHSDRIHDNAYQLQANGHLKNKKENESYPSCQLSTRQRETVDNLIQKLEDNIANELDRLSKQRATSDHHVKFEANLGNEVNQDALIGHLQDRMNDLRNNNIRLRDNQQSKSIFSSYNDNKNQHSFSSMRSYNYPST